MSIKGIVITVIGASFALVACGTGGGTTAAGVNAASQVIKYSVNAPNLEVKDANGVAHDNFTASTSTIVRAGVPVTIVVANYDTGEHGMFFPSLGISQLIAGSKVEGQAAETTFTFTPTKAGDLRWYCPVPCDTEKEGWAMSQSATGPAQDGFMAGTITVK